MQSSLDRPNPPALPATVTDLLAQRKSMRTRTLNDEVEEIHLKLWDTEPKYRTYLDAIWRENTVEGSFVADDLEAAGLIRQYAEDHDQTITQHAPKMAILRSLHVVCNRYQMSRKHRRGMVGGVTVPDVDNGNDE